MIASSERYREERERVCVIVLDRTKEWKSEIGIGLCGCIQMKEGNRESVRVCANKMRLCVNLYIVVCQNIQSVCVCECGCVWERESEWECRNFMMVI